LSKGKTNQDACTMIRICQNIMHVIYNNIIIYMYITSIIWQSYAIHGADSSSQCMFVLPSDLRALEHRSQILKDLRSCKETDKSAVRVETKLAGMGWHLVVGPRQHHLESIYLWAHKKLKLVKLSVWPLSFRICPGFKKLYQIHKGTRNLARSNV
jgi:hypothetical protein